MSEIMFSDDPLNPDWLRPTPRPLVDRLTQSKREVRVVRLMEMSREIYTREATKHSEGKNVVARAALFSGGNDSTTLAHLFLDVITHTIHANTGIGVEATRQFVRDTSAAWGVPLVEEHPPPGSTYRDIVLDQGFPGPGHHWKMYSRLKERALDRARHTLGVAGSPTKRVVFIAGRRRDESVRRRDVPFGEVDGSAIWVSPIALWLKSDLRTYRQMFDVPHNSVTDVLGMSGECLCLAFAQPGERERIIRHYAPDVALIAELEELLKDRIDIPPHRRVWGHAAWHDDKAEPSAPGRLCGPSCGVDPLFDLTGEAA